MSVTTAKPSPLASQSETKPSRLSCDEFFAWLDEDNKHSEWADGVIVRHGTISRVESSLKGFVMVAMQLFVEDHDLGDMTYSPFRMRLAHSSCIPEIAFIAKENEHRLKTYWLEGPADLIVEIVSPESRERDRGDKFREYKQSGVREYWLLDPERRSAEFYVLGVDGRYALVPIDDQGRFHSAVLAGFWLQVDWLWQDPLPSIWDVLKAWGM